MESVGFKEWAAVCDALGRGRQSIILRKGGIAEGRAGFSFQHRGFFLFPTWFHEQPQKIRNETNISRPNGDDIEINLFARLDLARVITSWTVAQALEPLHILRPEVVRERFEYDEAPGLHVAFARTFRVKPSWRFTNEKKYGGCRSWVKLPPVPTELELEPVLSDAEHGRRRDEFLTIVDAVRIRADNSTY